MKVAIVTGASRGIGKAIAERLAKDGFAVVVNYVSNAPEAEQAVAGIKAQGDQAIAIKADVSDASQVEQLFAQTLEGLGSIDVVVQNSGIMPLSPIAQQSRVSRRAPQSASRVDSKHSGCRKACRTGWRVVVVKG